MEMMSEMPQKSKQKLTMAAILAIVAVVAMGTTASSIPNAYAATSSRAQCCTTGDFATTSTSYVDVTGFTTTFNTGSGHSKSTATFTFGNYSPSSTNGQYARLLKDGTERNFVWTANTLHEAGALNSADSVTAASHTWKVQLKALNGGTAAIYGSTGVLGVMAADS